MQWTWNKILVRAVIITCYRKKTVSNKRPQILPIKRNAWPARSVHSDSRGRARGWSKSDFPGWVGEATLCSSQYSGLNKSSRIQVPKGIMNLVLVIVINNPLPTFAKHLLCVGTVLITSYTSSHILLDYTMWSYSCPYFTDVETGALTWGSVRK